MAGLEHGEADIDSRDLVDREGFRDVFVQTAAEYIAEHHAAAETDKIFAAVDDQILVAPGEYGHGVDEDRGWREDHEGLALGGPFHLGDDVDAADFGRG